MNMTTMVWNLFIKFIEQYGSDALILCILVLGGYKLFTNHLAHILQKITSVDRKVSLVNKKLNRTIKTVTNIDKRLTVQEKLYEVDKKK